MKSIGVDRGGSYTRLSIFDENFNEIKHFSVETKPLPEFVEQIKKIITEEKIEKLPMVISAKGAMTVKEIRDYITENVSKIANLKKVISDAEGAHRAAFEDKNGFLIIMGTGSVLIHKINDKYLIEGGKNPPEGDPGSGKWLGLKYLKTVESKENIEKMNDLTIASYSSTVIEKAQKEDKLCLEIINQAHKEFSLLIQSALTKYENINEMKIALIGGLSNDNYYTKGLENYVKENIKNIKFTFFRPDTTTEKASAIYAVSLEKSNQK